MCDDLVAPGRRDDHIEAYRGTRVRQLNGSGWPRRQDGIRAEYEEGLSARRSGQLGHD
jgi:hypothetical protein